METTRTENDPKPLDNAEKSQGTQELWRQRINRLLNRRCLNFRDPDQMESDDSELETLANEGRRLGYTLDKC